MTIRARSAPGCARPSAGCAWRSAPRARNRRPRRRPSSLTGDVSCLDTPTLTLPLRGREIGRGGRESPHQLAVEVEELEVQARRDLGLPQLAAPEDVPDPAPSSLEKVSHRPRGGGPVESALGDQTAGKPVGADRRLAGPHSGSGAPTDVLQRAHRRVLEPGSDVLRADQFAFADQGLQAELIAMWFGDAELRAAVPHF